MVQDLHWEDSWAILLVICVGASPPRHPPRARGHPNSHPNSLARDIPGWDVLNCNAEVGTATLSCHATATLRLYHGTAQASQSEATILPMRPRQLSQSFHAVRGDKDPVRPSSLLDRRTD